MVHLDFEWAKREVLEPVDLVERALVNDFCADIRVHARTYGSFRVHFVPPTGLLRGGFVVPSCPPQSQGYLMAAKELTHHFVPLHDESKWTGDFVHVCMYDPHVRVW
jgi:hypothetical protein